MSGNAFTHAVNNSIEKERVKIQRTNIIINREKYCKYDGECKVEYNQPDLCIHCIYKKKFDVPEILNNYIKGKL